mmetsp:Transcript_41457/g.125265  ORF Transcript_41457/g.125265 Transcript_41457/m.125265 type:complete len:399 (-) Transcript_41457:285-1481(-)
MHCRIQHRVLGQGLGELHVPLRGGFVVARALARLFDQAPAAKAAVARAAAARHSPCAAAVATRNPRAAVVDVPVALSTLDQIGPCPLRETAVGGRRLVRGQHEPVRQVRVQRQRVPMGLLDVRLHHEQLEQLHPGDGRHPQRLEEFIHVLPLGNELRHLLRESLPHLADVQRAHRLQQNLGRVRVDSRDDAHLLEERPSGGIVERRRQQMQGLFRERRPHPHANLQRRSVPDAFGGRIAAAQHGPAQRAQIRGALDQLGEQQPQTFQPAVGALPRQAVLRQQVAGRQAIDVGDGRPRAPVQQPDGRLGLAHEQGAHQGRVMILFPLSHPDDRLPVQTIGTEYVTQPSHDAHTSQTSRQMRGVDLDSRIVDGRVLGLPILAHAVPDFCRARRDTLLPAG